MIILLDIIVLFVFFRVAKVVAPKKAALKVAEGELAEAMGVRWRNGTTHCWLIHRNFLKYSSTLPWG